MIDAEFAHFFDSIAPRLGLCSHGFRRVRRTLRKRLTRRLAALGFRDLDEYTEYLDRHAAEWVWLDASCRITISRFGRDRAIFDAIASRYLPALASRAEVLGRASVRVWSAGCASGEEPYSLGIAWRLDVEALYPCLELELLATDADADLLERARRGTYAAGSLWELPERWRNEAFERQAQLWRVADRFRAGIRFEREDLREPRLDRRFDLVLCRNLCFSYFDEPLQRRVAQNLLSVLSTGGVLVLGKGEVLPSGITAAGLRGPSVYEKLSQGSPR